jgi:hypothetical protein
VIHPMSKLECAAHTILAMMDVLSTVFNAREHTAHVSLVGKWTKAARCSSVEAECPLFLSQLSSKSIMPEQTPLTMVQMLAHPKGLCNTYG